MSFCFLSQHHIFRHSFNDILSTMSRSHRTISQELNISEVGGRVSSGSNNVVSTMFLCFNDRSWEWSYMREPDLMLKYSTLMGFVMFVTILSMQTLNGT